MANTLILDKSQPEVAALVASWKNGGKYELGLSVEQIASDDETATFRVLEVESDDAAAEEAPIVKAPKTMLSSTPATASVGMEA